mgnify:CR=1 FL=1
MAKPDMKKTVEETFEKKDEGIEELLKKDQRQLSDAERERVGDYLLREDERVALSTFDPDRVPIGSGPPPRNYELDPPMKKKEWEIPELPTKVLKRAEEAPQKGMRPSWDDPADLLTRFGEEVADLPAEAYQANIERAAREKRRLEGQKQRHTDMWMRQAEIAAEGQRQAPGQAPRTDTQWAALREINEEIENLENRRNSSMNPERARQLEEEIQMLKERRSKMPGGRQPPSDMEDEGARTSYEDYLLRN